MSKGAGTVRQAQETKGPQQLLGERYEKKKALNLKGGSGDISVSWDMVLSRNCNLISLWLNPLRS